MQRGHNVTLQPGTRFDDVLTQGGIGIGDRLAIRIFKNNKKKFDI
jgi:hypothetical protein